MPSASLGCIGFMNAALGLRPDFLVFFAISSPFETPRGVTGEYHDFAVFQRENPSFSRVWFPYRSPSHLSWSTVTGFVYVLPPTDSVTRYVPGSTDGANPPRPPPPPNPPCGAPGG